jgi:hypothetical protein
MGLVLVGPAHAFPLTLVYGLCTLSSGDLQKGVGDFQAKLERARRTKTAGSAYRKHVEKHAGELVEALDAAAKGNECPAQRKTELQQLRAGFRRL